MLNKPLNSLESCAVTPPRSRCSAPRRCTHASTTPHSSPTSPTSGSSGAQRAVKSSRALGRRSAGRPAMLPTLQAASLGQHILKLSNHRWPQRHCCCRLGPTPHTTWLTFEVDFAFKSPLYRQVASIFFEEVRLLPLARLDWLPSALPPVASITFEEVHRLNRFSGCCRQNDPLQPVCRRAGCTSRDGIATSCTSPARLHHRRCPTLSHSRAAAGGAAHDGCLRGTLRQDVWSLLAAPPPGPRTAHVRGRTVSSSLAQAPTALSTMLLAYLRPRYPLPRSSLPAPALPPALVFLTHSLLRVISTLPYNRLAQRGGCMPPTERSCSLPCCPFCRCCPAFTPAVCTYTVLQS